MLHVKTQWPDGNSRMAEVSTYTLLTRGSRVMLAAAFSATALKNRHSAFGQTEPWSVSTGRLLLCPLTGVERPSGR